MNQNCKLSHKLIAVMLLSNLLLQSCNNSTVPSSYIEENEKELNKTSSFNHANSFAQTDVEQFQFSLTDLHHAARTGDLEEVQRLLANVSDINIPDQYGWTALHHAVSSDTDEDTVLSIIKLLLDNGANINAADSDGYTPLYYAIEYSREERKMLLIEREAKIVTETNAVEREKGSAKREAYYHPIKIRKGFNNEDWFREALLRELPAGYDLGTAYGDGDCFFDALAQWINNLNHTDVNTDKYLRMLCHEFYQANKRLVTDWNLKDSSIRVDNEDKYAQHEYYYSKIQYTSDECDSLFNEDACIWGRPWIEGIMLCQKLKIAGICIVEVFQDPETGNPVFSYHLVDQEGYKPSISEEKGRALVMGNNIPVLVNVQGELHFVPLLSCELRKARDQELAIRKFVQARPRDILPLSSKKLPNRNQHSYLPVDNNPSSKLLQEDSFQQQELQKRIVDQLFQPAYHQRIKLALYHQLVSPNFSEEQRSSLTELVKLITAPEKKLRLGGYREIRESFIANPVLDHQLFEPLRNHLQKLASYQRGFAGTPIELLLKELIDKHQEFMSSLVCQVRTLGPTSPVKLFEAKPLLQGEDFECYEVESEKAYQLACYNPHEYEYNSTGLRIGNMQRGVYFKVDDGRGLLKPAKEHAVYTLYQRLGLANLIAPTHLVFMNGLAVLPADIGESPERRELQQKKQELTTPSTQEVFYHYPELEIRIAFAQHKYPLRIQGSLVVTGKTLEKFLEEAEQNPDAEAVMNQLDPISFSSHILASLLLLPTDYKSDNLMVNGQNKIIGIDNDACLEAQELRELGDGKTHGISIKNILYLLPLMQAPVARGIQAKFINHHPGVLLLNWLVALQEKQLNYDNLLNASLLGQENVDLVKSNVEESLGLPLRFVPGWITGMYERFTKLQELLTTHPSITHQTLFKEIHPYASRYYQGLKKLYSQPLDQMVFVYDKMGSLNTELSNDFESLLVKYPEPGDQELLEKISETDYQEKEVILNIEQAIQELIESVNLKAYTADQELAWIECVVALHTWPVQLHPSWYDPTLLIRMVQTGASGGVIRALVEKAGAQIDAQDEIGETVLHSAVKKGGKDACKQLSILIQLGANLEAQNRQGITPLDLAAEQKDIAVFKHLVMLGAGEKAIAATINCFYQSLTETERQQFVPYITKLTQINPKVGWKISLNEIFPYQGKAKTTLSTVTEGDRVITEAVWNSLFEKDGTPKKVNAYGVRPVSFVEKNGRRIYVKFFPQLPGTELAVIRLAENLLGYCAPYCELASINGTPVLLSQGVPGETLYEVLQKYPERLKQLDPESVSKALILAMLINPGDGNLGNYIVSPFTNPAGQLKYRLISIDNDQAFMPAVAKSIKTGVFSSTPSLQVKTILYCLDAMKDPVSQKLIQQIQKKDLAKLLTNWLSSLKIHHEAAKDHFASNLLKRYQEDKASVIGVFLAPGMIKQLFTKLMRLQVALNKKTPPTHVKLLSSLEPVVAHRYRSVLENNQLTTIEKFRKVEQITGEQALTSSSNELLQLLMSKEIPDISELQADLWSGKFGPYQALKELKWIQKRYNYLDHIFKDLGKSDVQELKILPAAVLEKFLQEAVLTNLSLSEQKVLLEALKNQELRYVCLKNCSALTKNILASFNIEHIKKLDVSGCSNLGGISTTGLFGEYLLIMPTLICLRVDRSGITSIKLEAPNLKMLSARNCDKLKSISLLGCQPGKIDLRKSSSLSKKVIKPLFEQFPNTLIYLAPTKYTFRYRKLLYKKGISYQTSGKNKLALHYLKQAAKQSNKEAEYILDYIYEQKELEKDQEEKQELLSREHINVTTNQDKVSLLPTKYTPWFETQTTSNYTAILQSRYQKGRSELIGLNEDITKLACKEDTCKRINLQAIVEIAKFPSMEQQDLNSLFIPAEKKLSFNLIVRTNFLDNPTENHPIFEPLQEHLQLLKRQQEQIPDKKSVLSPLIEFYQEFVSSITKEAQEKKSQTISDRLSLLEPKVEMSGEMLKPYYLDKQLAYDLTSYDKYGHLHKLNSAGNSPVVFKQEIGVYFKADEEMACRLSPGKENAVYWFHKLLTDGGTTPIALINLQRLRLLPVEESTARRDLKKQAEAEGVEMYIKAIDNPQMVEPNRKFIDSLLRKRPELEQRIEAELVESSRMLQASRSVEGIRLDDFIRQVQQEQRSYEELDFASYASFVLATLLTHPTDYKADNLMVDTTGKIIGIDNDQILEADVLEGNQGGHFTNLTNVLYCLPLMQQKVPESVKILFKEHTPLLFLLRWLQVVQNHHSLYEMMVQQGTLASAQYEHELHLPLQFANGFIVRLYNRFQQIQKLLMIDSSLQEVFATLYPFEERYYAGLIKKYKDPFKVMHVLYATKRHDNITIEKISMEDVMNYEKQAGDEELQHKLNNYRILNEVQVPATLDQVTEELISNSDISVYKANEQLEILETIFSLPTLPKRFHASWEHPYLLHSLIRAGLSALSLYRMLAIFKPKIDINQKDEMGRTLLHATLDGTIESLENSLGQLDVLLAEGANTEVKDITGRTCLDLAAERKQWPFFERLVQSGAGSQSNPQGLIRFYKQLPSLEKGHQHIFSVLGQINPDFAWQLSLEQVLPREFEETCSQILLMASLLERKLPMHVTEQLYDEKGGIRRINRHGRRVNTWVRSTKPTEEEKKQRLLHPGEFAIYVKFYPELPGREEAVGWLVRRLFGYGTPYTEMGILKERNIPVLISQAIAGVTLCDYLLTHPYGEGIEAQSLSEAIITAILINPEDGNPTNYIISNGRPRRLVAIDNDHAFMPAIAREVKEGWMGKKLSLQVKTILYCLDAMKDTVHPAIVKRFASLDPFTVLQPWLEKLSRIHQRYQATFESDLIIQFSQAYETVIGVPFAPGMVRNLYTKMLRIQKKLAQAEPPTHLELLRSVEPTLARRYEGAISLTKHTILQRFQQVDGGFYKDGTVSTASLKDVLQSNNIPDKEELQKALWRNEYTPMQALEELRAIRQEHTGYNTIIAALKQNLRLPALTIEGLQEQFFEEHDFNTLALTVVQEQKLLGLLQGRDLRRLTIRNCNGLKGNFLTKQINLSGLTFLDLTGCSLNEVFLETLLREANILETLVLSHNPVLRKGMISFMLSTGPLTSNSLTSINLSASPKLEKLWLNMPALTRLDASHCAKLKNITLNVPSLRFLNLENDTLLTDLDGEKWIDKLQEVNINGCMSLPKELKRILRS